ncbi:TIGR03854 family LLM class F420-dependent oxidoreductase [Candidatus Frankia nodulisporulans]|uniref:TIGR03854 family LLM class F420-dependent oxidoreductase n=1 Tax=Candidatus Frankia nodulisporulans TaxID=2060052 RepID=UPI0013D16FE9|nr:TIGR03854 family LLM class F420-dependent oxidoreductase [Candidatus Frankia nodulisporulans]
MKVRIGIGFGGFGGVAPGEFVALVDRLEKLEIDSLWLSEQLSQPAVAPFAGLGFALGRTSRLKVGMGVTILPGRNPVLVAKELASLASLAPRRVLPVFGLAPGRDADRSAYPVPAGRRAAVFDEALTVVRLLLSEPRVTFHGEFFDLDEIGLGERPARPLDLWLGGAAPAALRRIGRLGDGWLASLVSPERAAAGIAEIRASAADAGRHIDDDHYGLSLRLAFTPPDAETLAAVRRRDPRADPARLLPVGWAAARAAIAEYIAVGVTKFVVHPAIEPGGWPAFLDSFVAELAPLEN